MALFPPADPRPDLKDDSALWAAVLSEAYANDGEDPNGLYGALSALRCCGARLKIENRSLIIKPDPEFWPTEAAWKADAVNYLGPHLSTLRPLLDKAIHVLPPAGANPQ